MRIILRRANGFPVTTQDPVAPSDPRDEKSREYWNAHPEGLQQRIERTRRYFRLVNRAKPARFAEGLEYHLEAR